MMIRRLGKRRGREDGMRGMGRIVGVKVGGRGGRRRCDYLLVLALIAGQVFGREPRRPYLPYLGGNTAEAQLSLAKTTLRTRAILEIG